MMQEYINKDGRKLRCGYTTGACAAAAAKAAAEMVLGGRDIESVYLMTPKGIGLTLPVLERERHGDWASCAIRKDAGDDPDVTDGMLIYARVRLFSSESLCIRIDGGEGIGRVTKPGLDQPPGEAAINSVPRRMITESLTETAHSYEYGGGICVRIYAPEGRERAEHTFNPRLGIEGGISILGTTGIVEPMSDEAVIETTRIELNMRAAQGERSLILTPGNYGEDYIKDTLRLDPQAAVKVSNYIGEALLCASEMGFESALLIGHIGKLVKLAGGMMNTHSRYGDCRAELFAAHAGLCGAGQETIQKLMDSAMTDDMLRILEEAGLALKVMDSLMKKIAFHVNAKTHGRMTVEVIAFSGRKGMHGMTPGAEALLKKAGKRE